MIHQSDVRGLSSNRLFRLLSVSSSAYYAWLKRKPSTQEIAKQELRELIAKVYWQHQGRYGDSRIDLDVANTLL